jgi:hypothetical protein
MGAKLELQYNSQIQHSQENLLPFELTSHRLRAQAFEQAKMIKRETKVEEAE